MLRPTRTWSPTHGHGVRWELEWDGSVFRYVYSVLGTLCLYYRVKLFTLTFVPFLLFHFSGGP